ncbi:MAG: head-tail adaptor protein [Pelagimonas sp.]|jgi:head-tail adaptor|nr:head-tail adaptor protein [Pelagimonas sp.]
MSKARVKTNRPLILESAMRVPDGAGGYDEVWSALGTLWGQVEARSGRLTNAHGATVSDLSVKITLRGAPVGASNRPVAGQRLRSGDRLFRVDSVSEDNAGGFYLICHCQEERAV